MTVHDNPTDDGCAEPVALPATLLPLIYHPDTGRLYWLGEHGATMSVKVNADGTASLAAAQPLAPAPGLPAVVQTLLSDIATYTCRPLPRPADPADQPEHDEYAVVWVDNSIYATTPRQAAEQGWRMMRRPGSQACVFQVVNRRTAYRVDVDLLDEEPDADPAVRFDADGGAS